MSDREKLMSGFVAKQGPRNKDSYTIETVAIITFGYLVGLSTPEVTAEEMKKHAVNIHKEVLEMIESAEKLMEQFKREAEADAV